MDRSRTKREHHDRVLLVSRIVWDNVVQWLMPPTHKYGSPLLTPPDLTREHCVTLARVGEGVFPLVPRVCRLILSRTHKFYTALGAAAEAGASSCLCWLLKSHNNTDEGIGSTTNEINFGAWRARGGGNKKEIIRLLGGLCRGGHLEMAQRLVDSVLRCSHNNNGEGVEAGPLASDVRDLARHVRSSSILVGVCENGHLGVARWLVERFNIRGETWELIWALLGAVRGGHLEVAQWVAGSSEKVLPLLIRHDYWLVIHSEACQSGNLGVVKWCFENIPLGSEITCFKLLPLVDGETPEYMKVCQFIKDHTPDCPADSSPLDEIGCLDVLKWATSAFPELVLSEENVEHLCEVVSRAHEMAKWVVEEKEIHPNVAMFQHACSNWEGNVSLVEFLAPKVELSDVILLDAFITSVARNNTAIASWLDDTFHIVEKSGAVSILMSVCKKISFSERGEGVVWLLNHPRMVSVDDTLIVKAVRHLVFRKRLSETPLIIIQEFPSIFKDPTRTELLNEILNLTATQGGNLTQVKKVISIGEFTKDAVAQSLTHTYFGRVSSKSVKWLITHFQLEREHITLDNIAILRNLLGNDHPSCAEWVINRFHITLDEVIGFEWQAFPLTGFCLFTWQMMLRMFPGITAGLIKQHLMNLVTTTPVMAQFTMQMFPDITTTDIENYWSHRPTYQVPLSVRLWLHSWFPTAHF